MADPKAIHFHALAGPVIELSSLGSSQLLSITSHSKQKWGFKFGTDSQEPASFRDHSSFHKHHYWPHHSFKWTPGGLSLPCMLCIFSDGFLKINNRKFPRLSNTQSWQYCQKEPNVADRKQNGTTKGDMGTRRHY